MLSPPGHGLPAHSTPLQIDNFCALDDEGEEAGPETGAAPQGSTPAASGAAAQQVGYVPSAMQRSVQAGSSTAAVQPRSALPLGQRPDQEGSSAQGTATAAAPEPVRTLQDEIAAMQAQRKAAAAAGGAQRASTANEGKSAAAEEEEEGEDEESASVPEVSAAKPVLLTGVPEAEDRASCETSRHGSQAGEGGAMLLPGACAAEQHAVESEVVVGQLLHAMQQEDAATAQQLGLMAGSSDGAGAAGVRAFACDEGFLMHPIFSTGSSAAPAWPPLFGN